MDPERPGRYCDKHKRWECTGRSKRPPHGPCHQAVGPGFGVCERHGARAPQVQAAALARRVRIEGFGHYVPGRPDQILLEEIARTHGLVLWLEQRLAATDREALTWGMAEERLEQNERNPSLTRVMRSGPSADLAWYQWERRHLASLTAKAAEIGIADRLVSLVKEQAEMMNTSVRDLLERLGLNEAQWRIADAAWPELMARVAAPDGQAMK